MFGQFATAEAEQRARAPDPSGSGLCHRPHPADLRVIGANFLNGVHVEGFVEARIGLIDRQAEAGEFIVPVALADAEIEPAAGQKRMPYSRVHADATRCGNQMSNIRNHDQDQHADRGHHEYRGQDKKPGIKLRQHHGRCLIRVIPRVKTPL
ncbi:MAG: hypothetical protein WBD83_01330 [Xanthobacteraceae bacterium]